MNNNLLNKVDNFLDQLIEEITSVGIDVSDLKIDHIAFSTTSSSEYELLLPALLEAGKLKREALVSDRRVAIITLDNPIEYKNQLIAVIELIEPKEGEMAISGWEHVEFLIDNYTSMLSKYPNLNWDTNHMNRESFSRLKLTLPSGLEVKFLNTPVLISADTE